MTSCAQLTLVLLKDRQRSEQNLKCLPSITGRTACGFQHQNSLALSSDDPLGLRYTMGGKRYNAFSVHVVPPRRDRNCKSIATRKSPIQLLARRASAFLSIGLAVRRGPKWDRYSHKSSKEGGARQEGVLAQSALVLQ
jgi:hypothetical protein